MEIKDFTTILVGLGSFLLGGVGVLIKMTTYLNKRDAAVIAGDDALKSRIEKHDLELSTIKESIGGLRGQCEGRRMEMQKDIERTVTGAISSLRTELLLASQSSNEQRIEQGVQIQNVMEQILTMNKSIIRLHDRLDQALSVGRRENGIPPVEERRHNDTI